MKKPPHPRPYDYPVHFNKATDDVIIHLDDDEERAESQQLRQTVNHLRGRLRTSEETLTLRAAEVCHFEFYFIQLNNPSLLQVL